MSSFTVRANVLVRGPFYFLFRAKRGGNFGQFKESEVALTPEPVITAEG